MPRDEIGVVDYFQETEGEKGDRLDGKTASAKMGKARRDDVKQAKLKIFNCLLYSYIVFNVLSIPCSATSLLTVSWFHYFGTTDSLSTAGTTIVVSEDWAIAINGIAIYVEYCDESDGKCDVSMDDFRYFSPDPDPAGFQWPAGAWADAAAKAASGNTYLLAGVGVYFAGNIAATVIMSMAFCNRDTRFRMIMGTLASVVALVSLVLGILGFVMSLTDFISLLETDNWVDEIYVPPLKQSYSLYLIGGTVGCQLVCAIVMFMLIKPKAECPDHILAEIHKHKTIRGKRTEKYCKDRDATTHITEQTPVDSFEGGAHKGIGWTMDVFTEQCNVMHTEDHCVNHPLETLSPPLRLAPIRPINKDTAVATELIEAPTSPTGFKAELCLEVLPQNLPGSVACAQAIHGFSKSTNLEKLRVATKQRTRKVTRCPPQETKRSRAKERSEVVISMNSYVAPIDRVA